VPPVPTHPQDVPALAMPRPIVALHPGGAPQWNRRWPLDRYAELGGRLAEAGASLVVLGDRGEREEVDALAARLRAVVPGARVVAERGLSVNGLAVLAAGLDLLVGNDSGPAHVAAAMRTPTVVLYGPTGTEFLWTRVYPEHVGVGRSPCQSITNVDFPEGFTPCEHRCARRYQGIDGPYPRCLTDIPVDRVWGVVRRRIQPRRATVPQMAGPSTG
jgi:ADP-heptose:LPS heptosyltransferase